MRLVHGGDTMLEAARRGDDAAFTRLYREHAGVARRYATRRCRSATMADDAVASAFAAVFRAILNGGGPTDDFRAYLLTAVRNAIVDEVRRRGALTEVADATTLDIAAADDADAADLVTLGTSMGAALDALPDRQREALWHTEVEGRTNDEMARRLELSANAFAALKMRARRNLADAYATQVAGGDVCSWVGDRADQYLTGVLQRADRLVVDLHAEHCAACAALVPDRQTAHARLLALPLVLAAPILLGRRRALAAPGRPSPPRGVRPLASKSVAGVAGVVVISGATLVLVVDDAPATSGARDRSSVMDVPARTVATSHSRAGDEPPRAAAGVHVVDPSSSAVENGGGPPTGAASGDVAPLYDEPVVAGAAPSSPVHVASSPVPTTATPIAAPPFEPAAAVPHTTSAPPQPPTSSTAAPVAPLPSTTLVAPPAVGTVLVAPSTTLPAPFYLPAATTTTTVPLVVAIGSTTTTVPRLVFVDGG